MRKTGSVPIFLALLALPAAAQDVLQFSAGTSVTWDDNVFRLPESVDPATRGLEGRSDRSIATYVGVRFDKPYVQQRFLLDATLTAYRYDRFSHLDFEATQYRAAWNWRATNRLAGTLSADRSQSLVNYSDFRDPSQRNVRTAENRAASADLRLVGGWNASAGLQQQRSRNSVTFLQERGFEADGGHVGIKYIAGSGNTLALLQRRLDGEYLERGLDAASLIDNGFVRDETEANLLWVLGGRSSLQARLARIEFDSNNFAARDFTGNAASLVFRRAATATLALDFGASRDESPSSDAFNRRVDERFNVGAGWQVAARTAIKATVYTGTTRFRDPVLPIAGPPRKERFTGGSLGADWRVHRLVTLNASMRREERDSNDPAFDFRGTAATLSASLAY